MRRQYFRIIRLYCRSIYDYIRIIGYIIRFLTDSNGYSLFFKAVGYLGILYIGTWHFEAFKVKYFGKTRHTYAAYAYKVYMLRIIFKINIHH